MQTALDVLIATPAEIVSSASGMLDNSRYCKFSTDWGISAWTIRSGGRREHRLKRKCSCITLRRRHWS